MQRAFFEDHWLTFSEISQESSTRTLSHVIRYVEDPEPDHEDGYRRRPESIGVAEEPADVSSVSNYDDSNDDRGGTGEDERTPATKAAGAAVAEVSDEWLNEEAGDGAAEPDDAGPLVRDPELLNIGSEERELKRPSELDSAGHRSYTQQLPEPDSRPSRRARRHGPFR